MGLARIAIVGRVEVRERADSRGRDGGVHAVVDLHGLVHGLVHVLGALMALGDDGILLHVHGEGGGLDSGF